VVSKARHGELLFVFFLMIVYDFFLQRLYLDNMPTSILANGIVD
jgi:hypothetical protein